MDLNELQTSITYLKRVQEMATRRFHYDETLHYELRADIGYIMSYTGDVLTKLEGEYKLRAGKK